MTAPPRAPRGRWSLIAALLVSLGAHATALGLLMHIVIPGSSRAAAPEVFDVGISWGRGGRAGSLPSELVSALPPAAGAPSLDRPGTPGEPLVLEAVVLEPAAREMPPADELHADLLADALPAALRLGLGRGQREGSDAAGAAREATAGPSDGAGDGLSVHPGTNVAGASPWGTLQGGTEGAGGSGVAGRGDSGAGGGVTPPLPLADNAPPAYPEGARRRGASGIVLVEVVVDRAGAALSASVVRSSGDAELDQAALDAVATWRFAATVDDGEPAERRISVPIHFRLHHARS